MKCPLLCLIIPCYKEKDNISELIGRAEEVLRCLEESLRYMFVLIDDGSPDGTWASIEAEVATRNTVYGLRFSRNFGKEHALTAGVAYATKTLKADAVICLDADLQHPPEYIPEFIRLWQDGNAVVVGIRKINAKAPYIKRLASRAFYWLMRQCSEVDIMQNSTDFRLIDKKVVSVVLKMKEHSRLFRGLVDWSGFRRACVFFDAQERRQGSPGYTMNKLFALAINSIASFSLLPLRLIGYLGVIATCSASIVLLVMIITDITNLNYYTTLAYFVVFLTILVGILLFGMGLLALYIGHIHRDVMARPLYVIEKIIIPTKLNKND